MAVAQVHQDATLCIVRETDGVTAKRLQPTQTVIHKARGDRRADTGVVLVQADSLDLQRLVIEEETLLRVEALGAEAALRFDLIDKRSRLFDTRNDLVKLRVAGAPQPRRIVNDLQVRRRVA